MKTILRFVTGRALTGIGLAAIASVVAAQSLSDFENTVGKKGCEGIPYSSLRDRCIDKQEDVDDYCKTVKLSCDDVDPEGLEKNIENMKGKVSELKDEKEDLEESKGSLTDSEEIRDAQAAVDELAARIKELEDKIARDTAKTYDEQNRIRERISSGEKCLDYRIAVWEVFKEAKSKARGESDPSIKPHAERLVTEWEAEDRGHEDAIYGFKQMLDKCKNML